MTNPTHNVRAIKEMLFNEKPNAFMAAKVPSMEIGKARAAMIVDGILPRNREMTRTTRTTVIKRVFLAS